MIKLRLMKELLLMAVILFAIFQALKSIYGSADREIFLLQQNKTLKIAQKQALEVNKDLCDGLTSYHSGAGLERLVRERLNLVGKDEIMVRIGK